MGEAKRRREAFYQLKPEERLGDAPVQAEYYEKMSAVVKAIDEFFNEKDKGNDRKVGFVLLTFPYGDSTGRCNFMSNGANRQDIVSMFKEMIARFEGQPEQKGGNA